MNGQLSRMTSSAGLLGFRWQQTARSRRLDCLEAGRNIELSENRAHMRVDGAAAEKEPIGDGVVGFAPGEQHQHIELTFRKQPRQLLPKLDFTLQLENVRHDFRICRSTSQPDERVKSIVAEVVV